jgi:glyceraldehyde-3-phosphate dehydrogenase (NADP+)
MRCDLRSTNFPEGFRSRSMTEFIPCVLFAIVNESAHVHLYVIDDWPEIPPIIAFNFKMTEAGTFDGLYYSGRLPSIVQATEYLIDGELKLWTGKTTPVYSPIYVKGSTQKIQIGVAPDMTEKESLEAIEAAYRAYGNGRGVWPTCTAKERIDCLEKFVKGLKEHRDEIVDLIMWEICKTKGDSEKEVDRTVKYIYDTITELKSLENKQSILTSDSGISALIKRVPLGTCLCVAPFNYPLNETYTTLIPAILMGNTVVLKIPKTGCLCHYPTLRLFQQCFPKGVVNAIYGSGRTLLPPIMKSGKVDILAFIGTHKAARSLQLDHPNVHRLRVVLGLDAKNSAVILPDADMKTAVAESVLGSLSFNGQRCTALKIFWVHESVADEFVAKFTEAVDKLKIGLPMDKDISITPLAEEDKPKYLTEVIEDAISKGAKIVNKRGGQKDRSFFAPTVLYPVTKDMRAYNEEQFGPICPIVRFKDIEEYYQYVSDSQFGQQASIFSTGKDRKLLAETIDVLSLQVSRVNLNTQCQRGPDSFPFNGRKNSAFNTLSVFDAIRSMSIRTVVATKENEENLEMVCELLTSKKSRHFRMSYLT